MRRRVPFSPRLIMLLIVCGPMLLVLGFALRDQPGAWVPVVIGAVLTCAGIAYIRLTRPHSYSRWTHAWIASQWGYKPPAARAPHHRDDDDGERSGPRRQQPPRRTGMSRRRRRRR
ncbi:hypothetical protein [Dactylosporangium sp. CA-139066]|uniref:hypothetical protein n=1 Tax=Dactylosporangium sp. CA-139066 TaxID=3239930 RepID=UPI003D9501CB